jgi:signal peptidase I
LLAIVGAGLGYVRMWPPLATVMSASMAPTINTGDMVVYQRLDRPARVGDVVKVDVPDEARSRFGYPSVVIHRVVKIAPDGMVTTKGDARKAADPFTVPATALDTRVVTHLPAAGQALAYFSSPLGKLWLISGAVMFFGMPLLERYRRGQGSRNDRDRALDEALQAAASAQTLLAEHLATLPAQIEQAVANAVASAEPPAPEPIVIPARPVPPPPPVPPRPTPDLMGIFAPPAKPRARLIAASAWDAPPAKRFSRERASHGVLCAVAA